jgi:hypothetical protein
VTLASVTHRIPRQINAGDSIEFLIAIPDGYEAWTGAARLVGQSQMAATVTTEDGDYRVRFPGQASGTSGVFKTAQLIPGQYTLSVFATNGDDRKTVITQPITIAPDPANTTTAEPHCVKMLRIVEAAIAARVSGNSDGGLDAYVIDGTQATKVPLEKLEQLRNKYSAEVAALNTGGQFGRVKFAMSPAGGIADFRRRIG